MKYIEVEITDDGEVKIEAKGFTDGACLAATKEIEEAIGKTVKDTKTVHGGGTQAKAILR
jgi:hypothetical protein